jgi:hypothetical protein
LPGLIFLLFIYRWVHFQLFKNNHPKEVIRFRVISPYPQTDIYATGSNNKRTFMTNSNRLLYVFYSLLGFYALLVFIPLLA